MKYLKKIFVFPCNQIPDPRNVKKHYQSFLREKNRKSLTQ